VEELHTAFLFLNDSVLVRPLLAYFMETAIKELDLRANKYLGRNMSENRGG
jgi:hypothetical protein